MKLISLSDWHITSGSPIARIDDYGAAQMRKVQQLVDWSIEYQAPILCAADLFDSNRISYKTFHQLQQTLMLANRPIYVIRGNHDSYYHDRNISGTPLAVLRDSGAVTYLESDTLEIGYKVHLHGYGWGEEPGYPDEGVFNILMVHKSVFEGEIPFYFEGKEAYTPKSLEIAYPGFDLYLAGDIHIPVVEWPVIVSGSMMRSTTLQKAYKPRAYLIDTHSYEVQPLFFDIEPDVFREELTEEKIDGYSETLGDLVNALKKSSESPTEFKQACFDLTEDKKITTILQEIFNDVEEA